MAITIEYCNKYNSYNGKEVKDGECLAPVLFSEEMITSDNTVIRSNLKTWKHFGVKFKVGFMVVKVEDFPKMLSLYNNCVNDYFNQHPEKKRGRCAIAWDEYGYPILCSKENKCIGCPHRYEHLPRYKSLDDFLKFESFDAPIEGEEGNTEYLDVPDNTAMPVEDVATLVYAIAILHSGLVLKILSPSALVSSALTERGIYVSKVPTLGSSPYIS